MGPSAALTSPEFEDQLMILLSEVLTDWAVHAAGCRPLSHSADASCRGPSRAAAEAAEAADSERSSPQNFEACRLELLGQL